MTEQCTVLYDGQVLRPDMPLDLPPNSRYQVTLTPLPPVRSGEAAPRSVWQVLDEHAGSVEGPEDWSSENDHYLYGTPKRNEKPQS